LERCNINYHKKSASICVKALEKFKLMKRFILLLLLFSNALLQAQNYTSWIVGDASDVSTNAIQTTVLAGGAGDNDDAMKWMLQRANGGDVLVIRVSGGDGYNDYFYSDLNVNVNSVETIKFNNPTAAQDSYVINQIENAEVLFIAGGDQYDYYQYWKDTPVEDAINFLINEKKAIVGGTSAGMAILGKAYYTPDMLGAISEEALLDPFHENMDIIGLDDFISHPQLTNVITDTHYDQRDRAGRHFTFMARLVNDHGIRAFGIASNEYVAIGIDENNTARVFGEFEEFDDEVAYFLQANCLDDFTPEVCSEKTPLTWNRNQEAVKVYKVPGTSTGENTFNLYDWETGSGGEWQDWYADGGQLIKVENAFPPACLVSNKNIEEIKPLQVYPNPTNDFLNIVFDNNNSNIQLDIYNLTGQKVVSTKYQNKINLAFLPKGMYYIHLQDASQIMIQSFIKI